MSSYANPAYEVPPILRERLAKVCRKHRGNGARAIRDMTQPLYRSRSTCGRIVGYAATAEDAVQDCLDGIKWMEGEGL